MAGQRLGIEELRSLFTNEETLLGKGRQGSVASSPDGLMAIKRQPLAQSDQERRQGVDAATAAYMSARAGSLGYGPRVLQYEADPAEGMAYLVMENLAPSGYKTLDLLNLPQEDYKKVYAQQQLLGARAAAEGLKLRDTHSGNVMLHPETRDIRFIDQGFAMPISDPGKKATSQLLAISSGMMNLDMSDEADQLLERIYSLKRNKDATGLQALAANAMQKYEQALSAALVPQ
jgi:hypothetical protein